MAQGRPDYFSQPVTLKYGTTVLTNVEQGDASVGTPFTYSPTFVGVLHELVLKMTHLRIGYANLIDLYLDDQLVLYGFGTSLFDSSPGRCEIALMSIIDKNVQDETYCLRIVWGKRINSGLRLRVYNDNAAEVIHCKCLTVYEDISD